MSRPLAIDLFCGLFGWAEGLVAEGWEVIGFDLEDMCGQFGLVRPPHTQLVVQDVLTLDGAQFRDADLIVASPPCQAYSYMAMPWSKAKAKAAAIRADESGEMLADLNRLFDACFRIQREACEAAGRHIPLIVENVRGAQPWAGRARWNFGSFYFWGDVPALMPPTVNRLGGRKNSGGSWFNIGSPGQKETNQNPVHRLAKVPSLDGVRRTDPGKGARFTSRDCGVEATGIKQGGDWFNAEQPSISRRTGSKSPARKAASAMIAKIPLPLSRHIGKVFMVEPV